MGDARVGGDEHGHPLENVHGAGAGHRHPLLTQRRGGQLKPEPGTAQQNELLQRVGFGVVRLARGTVVGHCDHPFWASD